MTPGHDPAAVLRAMFADAVAAADPAAAVSRHLPAPPPGRTLVLAAGKAGAAMARAVEDIWPRRLNGVAVVRYGHALACRRVEVVEAGHPVPDAVGAAVAERFLDEATALGPDDLLLFLISGGASALLVRPAHGLDLAAKQAVNGALLSSGASIGEMNCLRRHLSGIKGGRLAVAASPARVATLAISDVPGDDPSVIGSGPTAPDPASCADALAIARKYRIPLPPAARDALEAGRWESVKPGDPALSGADYRIVVRPADALEAAMAGARRHRFRAVNLGDDLEGEARDLACGHAVLAAGMAPASVAVSGGETTVTIAHPGGSGGRNCEYLLALAIALDGAPGIHAIACDTDGIDGTGDAAGAVIGPDTLERARALELDAAAMLERHDSYGFFAALGDLVVTGPTLTNVNDFRAILVEDSCR